ncbi:MAG: pullulanase-associated domain-containing protein, partial [Candidatus Izemoplasmatales bacterium]
MKKIIQIILMLFVLLSGLSLFQVVDADSSSATSLVVHYKRFDGNESNYNLWLWPSGGDGAQFGFSSSDTYGAVATINLGSTNLSGVDSVGILVYQVVGGVWIKDVDQDRYIDMTHPNANGEVHIYVLTGETFISYVSEDQAGCNIAAPDPFLCAQTIDEGLVDVYFDETYKIHFTITDSITSSNITILDNDTPVPFSGFSSGGTGTLTLTNPVNVSHTYTFILNWNGIHNEQVIRLEADYDSEAFQLMYNYDGELGAIYTSVETTFKVWAPVSGRVQVNLYSAGHTTTERADGVNSPYAVYELDYTSKGVWSISIPGDLAGKYYTFNVMNDGVWVTDIQDPYGKSFGLNGRRAMVVNFDLIDPEGWSADQGVDGYENPNNAIIYELHVRDLTSQAAEWGGPLAYS